MEEAPCAGCPAGTVDPHLESLNDVVAQITGVRVRETVSDSILEQADEMELIDLYTDELLQRLREGKVYVAAQASRAIEHFFSKGNLMALWEVALRRSTSTPRCRPTGPPTRLGTRGRRRSACWCVSAPVPSRSGWCGRRAGWRPGCGRNG